jgi:KUP system potassium uptake protein
MLFLGVVLLVLTFKNSESLASAYGISVTGAMAIDTLLASYFMISVKNWNKAVFVPIFAVLFSLDLIFLIANLFKFFEGGWLPIVVASLVLLVMISWISGRERLLKARWSNSINLTDFLSVIRQGDPIRVPGTAVFMVPHQNIVPMALMHNLKHNKVLHETVLLLNVIFDNVPSIENDKRIFIKPHLHNFFEIQVHYGFMEEPNMLDIMKLLDAQGVKNELMATSFFIGREKVVPKKNSPWFLNLFVFLHRVMLGATEYFQIPLEHSIELGGYIEI